MLMCWVPFQHDTAGASAESTWAALVSAGSNTHVLPSSSLPRALFDGAPLTTQQTSTAGSTGEGSSYLTESTHRLLLKVRHGWSLPWQAVEPPFDTHWHESRLFHGALNVIWDQLFDRNCTSLCTWHFFKLIKLQWEILYSLHIAWEMVTLHCLSVFKSLENCKFYIIIPSLP